MKGGANQQQDDAQIEERQEMNELIDSDPELYAGDCEDNSTSTRKKKSKREKFKNEI